MPRATYMQNSLTSGEWSPRALGRTDLAKYQSGTKKLENFLINQLGGVSYRPGTRYITSTKNNATARLFPFQYSADQDYVVEAGNEYFRLFGNAADAITITGYDEYTKLLLHADGNDGSTSFIDEIGHTVTANGDIQMGRGGSLLLDGDSDYITFLDSADWDFGTGDFTVDCWVRISALPNNSHYMLASQYVDSTHQWYWSLYNDGATTKFNFYHDNAGNQINILSSALTLVVDTWYHIAVVRTTATNIMTFYLNGVDVGHPAVTTQVMGDFASTLRIGARNADFFFNGWIDELRISKGIARWTSDFTPQTITYNPDTYTKLLLHFDELNNSVVCTDSETTPKTATVVGTAKVVTAQYKVLDRIFGSTSALLDGTGDFLSLLDSDDWDFDGNFTIECWVKWLSVGTTSIIGNGHNTGWMLYYEAGILRFDAANSVRRTEAFTPVVNTWYHLAVVRNGAAISIYVNGTTAGSSNYATAILSAKVLQIGRDPDSANLLNGRVDEVRISKGIARWTANFTVPITPYAIITSAEVTTPYLEAHIPNLHYAQNNDILYIVHPSYAPRKLSRTSPTSFALSLVSFVRGPFLDTNITATTITPSSATGATTLTASTAIFNILHIGSLWRINKDASTGAVVKITGYTSTTVVSGVVQNEPDGTAGNIGGTGAYTNWAEGAFSAYRGYPSAIAFHEQRLYYANTPHEPQKFWGSYIGAYDSFDNRATTANYAITFEVATEQRNEIKWLSSGNKVLNIGTTGGTFSASSGDTSAPISPTNIMVNRDTNYGVANLLPKRISSFLYYIQRDFQKLRELSYSFQIDSTISSDMTLLAEHILKDGTKVLYLDHQQAPNDRIYCIRNDGQLAVLTRNPEQEVMGWCRIIAGDDAQGSGLFESICVIPKAEADDQVWVIVKRVINGVTKRFIEYFMPENFDEDWDAIRCDSSLTLDSPKTITGATNASPGVFTCVTHGFSTNDQVKINGVIGMNIDGIYLLVEGVDADHFTLKTLTGTAIDTTLSGTYISGGEIRKMVTSISGLGHLVGETVIVQTDGYIPSTETYVVQAGGFITLSEKSAVVHAGLPYDGTIQLLKLSDGNPTGTGQTQTRRIYLGTLRVDRSQGLSIGRNETDLDSIIYDVDGSVSSDLYTGDVEKVFKTTWDKADELIIRQSKPLPANILAIILESEVTG